MHLDKFYTHPDIAKKFVETVDRLCDFSVYDEIIEPSAGSGNISQFLPDGHIAMDLEPEESGIIQQDFFEYESSYHPLFDPKRILTIGNPPFGTGYMNPLAKRFLNHAAEFSETIAFIIPQKWHTAWKVHFQLDQKFGLYYSEVLPKNSFVADGKTYDVNCCAQIWSARPIDDLPNLRIKSRPPTSHSDFDMFLTCDNVNRLSQVREQLERGEYWEFGLKYWGKIGVCDIDTVPSTTTTHYVFKPNKPFVREILEKVDWSRYVNNMGAPNVGGKSLLVKAYVETKERLGYV